MDGVVCVWKGMYTNGIVGALVVLGFSVVVVDVVCGWKGMYTIGITGVLVVIGFSVVVEVVVCIWTGTYRNAIAGVVAEGWSLLWGGDFDVVVCIGWYV